jgi:hypothetical protein
MPWKYPKGGNMGLDCFWKPGKNSQEPKFNRKLKLCGGIFSEGNELSFRGKVYADFIEEFTGVSLYQKEVSEEDVKEIARKLNSELLDKLVFYGETHYNMTRQEVEDLVHMFNVYAKANWKIFSWW